MDLVYPNTYSKRICTYQGLKEKRKITSFHFIPRLPYFKNFSSGFEGTQHKLSWDRSPL